jgi:hypothetical protein
MGGRAVRSSSVKGRVENPRPFKRVQLHGELIGDQANVVVVTSTHWGAQDAPSQF